LGSSDAGSLDTENLICLDGWQRACKVEVDSWLGQLSRRHWSVLCSIYVQDLLTCQSASHSLNPSVEPGPIQSLSSSHSTLSSFVRHLHRLLPNLNTPDDQTSLTCSYSQYPCLGHTIHSSSNSPTDPNSSWLSNLSFLILTLRSGAWECW
jgi:hypothetical protein